MTTECTCRLWPMPGMYVLTMRPLDSRTYATLRRPELGFLGDVTKTFVHTPFLHPTPSSHFENLLNFHLGTIFGRRL
eukprot:CAMPEP_0171077286 /NCGR_PEP_ID=MMETSP0766_2-20121228/13939_1 /TAXON_ID=439317 /ORGANISM="Gambierdiscus australes, Strain CAWD 149" /LENGTH=76 /DNA_ID=CAMNT_0011534329 /DNA_START=300 /DNA_END=530 /DNA_ORIENTATION=-